MPNLKHQYREFSERLTKRLVFDADKPADVATEFKKTEVASDKPAAINIDAQRDIALKKLDSIAKDKKSPEYLKAVKDIKDHAESLKKKQNYFKEKAKLLAQDKDFLSTAIKVDSATSYGKSADRVVNMGRLMLLRDEAGLSDDTSLSEPLKANKEANSKYFDSVLSEAKTKIADLSKDLESYGKKDSKVKMKDLAGRLEALKAPMAAFNMFKSKGFQGLNKPSITALGGENKDIEENYFAVVNLVNAKYNFEQTKGLDDSDPENKEKKDLALKWLQGAELLQSMRTAKASAWESWNKIKDLPGSEELAKSEHPAQKAWELGNSKSKVDFDAAKKAYLVAKGEYDKFYTEREPVAKAKEKADNAFKKIPDKINVYMAPGEPYAFTMLAKTNGKLKGDYDEAGKLLATDPKKAEQKYLDAEKKYNATAAKIADLEGKAALVNSIYTYQENLPDIKNKMVARSTQLDTFRGAISAAYIAARSFMYDADSAAADAEFNKHSADYNRVLQNYYYTQGKVKPTDQPAPAPVPKVENKTNKT